MRVKGRVVRGFRHILFAIASTCVCALSNAQTPADTLVQVVAALMLPEGTQHTFYGWNDLDAAKQVRWASSPPRMLDDALPDGAYFALEGMVRGDGHRLSVEATGVRTMVTNVYFRNHGAALGETAVLAALNRAGLKVELVRCPIAASPAASNKWWRITGPGKRPAWFHSQASCNGARCESYALLLGETLRTMIPKEQRLYTDSCTPGTSAARPAPAAEWDEKLASLLAALIPQQGATSVAWGALERATAVRWMPLPPREAGEPPMPDGNRHYRVGETDLGGRVLGVTATGTRDSVYHIYFADQATQADRGDALRALWSKGYNVWLARCGKRYQLSTQTWYRVTGPASRPVMIQRGIRCDTTACPRAQEEYQLAITAALPPLQPGEVDAVGDSCPGR